MEEQDKQLMLDLHARNIKGNFTEVGFGRSGNYWCVIFGTPKN